MDSPTHLLWRKSFRISTSTIRGIPALTAAEAMARRGGDSRARSRPSYHQLGRCFRRRRSDPAMYTATVTDSSAATSVRATASAAE